MDREGGIFSLQVHPILPGVSHATEGSGQSGYDELSFPRNHVRDRSKSTTSLDVQHFKSRYELTAEAIPREHHYWSTKENGYGRPTLDALHSISVIENPKNVTEKRLEEGLNKGVIKMGWVKGVFMKCLLNIWGVMLFLRLSWVMGQTGIGQGILLISSCNIVTLLTSISMSAVTTNGQIKGGGIYYMISRSLGPEFGGAIGLMFTIANSIACAMYVIGFCDSLKALLANEFSTSLIDGEDNYTRVVGCAAIVVILAIVIVGIDWVSRTEVVLLVILLAAQLDFVIGTFIGPTDDKNLARGFVGYRKEVFYRNIQSAYGPSGIEAKDQDFFSVFGIFFPAVTGIVAGANFSGDLKDPSSAIPKGTLAAVVLTYISYIGYALMLAGCEVREASGEVSELDKNLTNILESVAFNCTDRSCKWGLQNNDQMITAASAWFPLIYGGCFAATLSSAIASLAGGPRVFQALAKDKLYPGIGFFAVGYGANNDPVRGYFASFIIAVACILIANLNAVAALVVNFFLAAYALINFSVFHASITKAPGWRPSFKYYNAWLSLLGTIISVVVMFMIQWDVALATLGVTISLYLLVQYRKPEANWGSSTQAQIYSTALKNTHELNKTAEHVKNYRPQLLVLAGPPSSRPPLLDFAYLITKSYSLLVVGHVVKGRMRHSERSSLIHKGYAWLQRHGIKSFYDIAESDRFDLGAKSLLQLSGLGKLRPNILLLGFKADWGSCDPSQTLQYFNVIHDAFDNHTAVGILRVEEGLDYSEVLEEEPLSYVENKVLKNVKTETSLGEMGEESNSSSASVTSGDNPSTNETENKTQKKEKETKNKAKQKQPSQIYRRPDGAALPKTVINNLTQFQQKQKKDARIDVWWLYDDGGLTILLPYILTQRSQFSSASLRIFCLASSNELEKEQRSMAALLSKFRIDYSDVVIISDFKKKAAPELYQEFDALIEPFKEKSGETREPGTYIPDAELMATQNKNSRHVKLRELLLYHSIDASLIVMTLPMPRKGMVSAPLYMAWLDTLTKGMPPFLAVRGNQTSVITFHS